jgi:nucleoid DNA-binding protein
MAKSKKAARKPAARKSAPKMGAVKQVMSKSALVAHLSGTTGVRAVIAALEATIHASLSKRGPRTFVLPGLLKITVSDVPAKKARKGINPFTGEETVFKAKPATVRVKVRPMKRLKDAARA